MPKCTIDLTALRNTGFNVTTSASTITIERPIGILDPALALDPDIKSDLEKEGISVKRLAKLEFQANKRFYRKLFQANVKQFLYFE